MKIKEIKIVNQDGSTELANIGADAVNVDYNNTNVKSKLDELSNNIDTNTTNISNEMIARANAVTNLQSQINELADGSPLPVSSISKMTDTKRIYVLTTNGHWYWFNGTSWVDGGVYQAAEDSETVNQLKQDINEYNNLGSINISSIATVADNEYISFETGIRYPHNLYELLLFENKNYKKIAFNTNHAGTSPIAIAFYSIDTRNPSSYMKSQSVQAKDGSRCYVVDIPEEAKVIVICNRKNLGSVNGTIFVDNTSNTKDDSKILDAFLSGLYNYSNFEKDGLLFVTKNGEEEISKSTRNKTTLHISLEGVKYIKYQNIYGNYESVGHGKFVGISFYDKFHNYITSPILDSKIQNGIIDLADYSNDVAFARFSSYNDVTDCKIALYSETLEAAKKRNKIYFGAYYFAGWSEWELPNIHFTESLLTKFSNRKPAWGWFSHGSYRCDAWLYSPEITLGNGNTIAELVGSCVFNKANCSINIFSDGNWEKLNVDLGNENNPEINTITFDLSAYANKTIKLGFRIFNKNTDISPIWTINGLNIKTNGRVVFNRDFTNDGIKDFTTNDEETWKHGIPTLAYNNINGYVGTAYDTSNTSIIDKEIILAKEKGIDYFILDWYYHDNHSTINEQAIKEEGNHVAVNAFINAAHKYNFKYCIMISNHEPFVIEGLENWKSAIRYINDTYIKDPSYLKYDGRPVINIFDNTYLEPIKEQLDLFIKNELGYENGFIWEICGKNTGYNMTLPYLEPDEEPTEHPYSDILTPTKWTVQDMFEFQEQEKVYPFLTVRWDTRPWAVRPGGYARNTDYCVTTVEQWKEAISWAIRWTRAYQLGFKSILLYAWNEMGEGGYLVPTAGDSEASFLCAIEEVIREQNVKLLL